MVDLTIILPPEIIHRIFSFLSQQDCIECVTVCSRWFDLVPLSATVPWRTLEISARHWNRSSIAILQCLGPQVVSSVSIKAKDSISVLKQLNCNIKALAIENDTQKISRRKAYDNDQLLPAAIRHFGTTLSDLSIYAHPHDISLTMLLDTLPNLERLSVIFSDDIACDGQKIRSIGTIEELEGRRERRADLHKKLVLLQLDNALNYKYRILPILKRCPNLKFLLLSPTEHRKPNQCTVPDWVIRTVHETCPLVRYIMWNHFDSKTYKKWWSLSADKSIDSMTMTTTSRYKNLLPTLEKYYQAVEELSVSSNRDNSRFWDSLATTRFARSISLNLDYVGWTHQDWNRFFTTKQHIEYLQLKIQNHGAATENLDGYMASIGMLVRLKYLTLHHYGYINLSYMFYDLDFLLRTRLLEKVSFANVPVSDQGLKNLASLPRLRELRLFSLSWGGMQTRITEDGWFTCAIQLRELNSIRVLGLEYAPHVTDFVLHQLSKIESLETLIVTGNDDITEYGVSTFILSRNGARKNISLRKCRNVRNNSANFSTVSTTTTSTSIMYY